MYKYSDVQPQIDQLVADALEHASGIDKIKSVNELWAAPKPLTTPIADHCVRPHALGESLSWACSQVTRLHIGEFYFHSGWSVLCYSFMRALRASWAHHALTNSLNGQGTECPELFS